MKKIKIRIKIICFCLLFLLCGKVLEYLLIDDSESFTRLMIHELYNQDSNIDVLFVGSSHCYCSFNPEIMDTALGKNTFNAGSTLQGLDGSLIMIKEAVQENDIQQIYLELYYDIAFKEPYKERSEMTTVYMLSDFLNPSLRKVDYLINASSKEHYANSFILARRNWEKLLDPGYITELWKKKATEDYKSYAYTYATTYNEIYVGKGYMSTPLKMENGSFFSNYSIDPLDISAISEDWKNSLLEIINYCKDNGIELTLVSAPVSNFQLTAVGNYDAYIDFVNEFIRDTGIQYYDFNLCKENYFPNDGTLFRDMGHLNYPGAELFDNLFMDFFSGKISEDDLFYHSYQEKLEHLQEDIFGITSLEDPKQHCIAIEPVANAPVEEVTYKVTRYSEAGEPVDVIDVLDPFPTIVYPAGESGTFEVITYLSGVQKGKITFFYGKGE